MVESLQKNNLKKFGGELKWINPNFLVTENNVNRIESFFIGLGLVFNDLKGLILFEKLLIENYEKPDSKATIHTGNYGGMLVQLQRLMASTINEFFSFLKESDDVISSNEFINILNKIPKSDKQSWDTIVAAAHGKLPSAESLLKAILFIRSNIVSHYDHSGKILRRGFISFFFSEEKKDFKNEYAYYSIGKDIESTRFCFSDAAAEESLYIAAGKKFKKNSTGDISAEKYRQGIRETIIIMNSTITILLGAYIKSRRNMPH